MNSNIPTTNEIISTMIYGHKRDIPNNQWLLELLTPDQVQDAMIEFTKIHVKEALKSAYQKVQPANPARYDGDVDRNSILNAYPETNIK